MDLQKLSAFVCVAKWRSFTKASAELFISQPALSKKISDFEKELGAILFVRDNRTVELTEAGQLLYSEAPVLLRYGDELEGKVRALGENPNSRLTIGCTGIEYGRLSRTLYGFHQAHPEISLTLHRYTAAEIRSHICGNMLDIAFQTRFELENESDVSGIPFDRDELAVVVSKFHPLAGEREISMEQLRGETYIGIQPTSDHVPFVRMIDMLEKTGYSPEGIAIASTVDELVISVSCGLAIGHLFSQTRDVYGGMISYLRTRDCSIQLEVDMVWNNGNKNKAKKLLIDYVKEENSKRGRF